MEFPCHTNVKGNSGTKIGLTLYLTIIFLACLKPFVFIW